MKISSEDGSFEISENDESMVMLGEDERTKVLNVLISKFKNKCDNINNWIKANPNTSVNFAELIKCISEYGELNSEYAQIYAERGTKKKVQGEQEKHIMPLLFPEMKAARDSLEEMIKLRANDEFFDDGFAKGFRNDLLSAAALGEYHIADAVTDSVKSDVLSTLASIYFYIWDTKKREPEYQYDNVNEWNGLKQNYEEYKNSVGVQERVEYTDGSIYEGPQFGSDIEDMMYRVENNLIMSDYFEKKQDVEDQELSNLNSKANVLNNRYKGINDFIRNNRDSAPNFREMVDSVIEYGKLISEFGGYYSRIGYPVLSEENREITNFEIPMVNEEVRGAQEGIYEMMQLRGNHQFFKDTTARSFMNELANVAAVGAYDIPSDPQIDNLKKDVLCQAAGIYFYIWDTQSREPNYKYDNVNEWNDLNEKYALYKESVGIQESRENADFSIYEGPQFGRVIEDMLAEIKKYSIIQDTNVNEAHK